MSAVGGPEGTAPAGDEAERWAAREVRHDGSPENVSDHGQPGWHVIGEVGNDPDPMVREFYDLHVQYAHDGDGGDCSAWLAQRVADALSAPSRSGRPDPGEDDPRVDILAAVFVGDAWQFINDRNREPLRDSARDVLARLDAASPSSATTEGEGQ